MKIFFKTLSAHCFLKIELVPQFRQYLNVLHIQNLEQPFFIWAGNRPIKQDARRRGIPVPRPELGLLGVEEDRHAREAAR